MLSHQPSDFSRRDRSGEIGLIGRARIVVLQAGRVVQDDAPDQLMRRDGHYCEMIMREMSRLGRAA